MRIIAYAFQKCPFIVEDNKGVGFARQFLINKSHRNVYRVPRLVDDAWHPNKLQEQLAKLVCSGADICICDYQVLDEAGKKLGVRRMPKTSIIFFTSFSLFPQVWFYFVKKSHKM